MKNFKSLLSFGLLGVLGALPTTSFALADQPKVRPAVYVHPREKFEKISDNKKQMWVVGYVNSTVEDSIKDLEESFNNGADAIVYEGSDLAKLESTIAQIRKLYPNRAIGVNFLGAGKVTDAYIETFRIAKKLKLQIAWTDFSGVDQIKEAPDVNLHVMEAARSHDFFYCSGIHMKYSTLVNPEKTIEQSALQAMGWIDGIVITGPKTGVPTDPDRAKRARSVIGNYPMGAASGTSAENIHTILPYIDYVLVNSSISDANHRIIGAKVKLLREALNKPTN